MSDTDAAGPDFPPARHVIRDLAMSSQRVAEGRHVTVVPVPDSVRDRAGRPMVGLLATLADAVSAGVVLPAVAPDWLSTADLAVHAADRPVAGPLVADARLVRAGSRLVAVRVTVHDVEGQGPEEVLDHLEVARDAPVSGPLAAEVLLSFVRMPSDRSRVSVVDRDMAFGRSAMGPDAVPTEPLLDRCGVRVVDGASGTIEVGHREYVRNSMGAVTGGVHAIAMQAAAEVVEPELVANGIEVRFLSAAKVGPLRASATPIRSGPDHAVHLVELVDQGNGRLVSVGTVTLDRP